MLCFEYFFPFQLESYIAEGGANWKAFSKFLTHKLVILSKYFFAQLEIYIDFSNFSFLNDLIQLPDIKHLSVKKQNKKTCKAYKVTYNALILPR
jgi:hypothetical protein